MCVSSTERPYPDVVPEPAKKSGYHHGDLREALVDATIELIAERGVHGFSIAEASRRVGVTSAAPYRHFSDRDELLEAAAVRASGHLATAVAAETGTHEPPADRLAGAARAYVRFAAEHRSLFQTLYSSGLDKTDRPELQRAARPVVGAFMEPARVLTDDERGAGELALAVAATAHGFATLVLEERGDADAGIVQNVVTRAGRAASALVDGWSS